MYSRSMKTLVLGGVKSGKSRYALQLVEHASEVLFIATARAGDEEMQDRIERHQQERPAHWRLIEEPRYLSERLQELNADTSLNDATVVIDCLTLWLTQLCDETLDPERLAMESQKLVDAVQDSRHRVILVSNELNMGITPLGEFSRRYCDAAGLLHQWLATVCDSVTLVIAGLPQHLKNNLT